MGRLSEVPFLIDNEKYIKYTLEKNEVIELSNEEQQFSYRHSIFSNKGFIILETKLNLSCCVCVRSQPSKERSPRRQRIW